MKLRVLLYCLLGGLPLLIAALGAGHFIWWWLSGILVGALIWIAGGLAPLIVPNELMVTTQRMIHIVEILTQNALLGITAALLLRPKLTSANSQTASIATVIS